MARHLFGPTLTTAVWDAAGNVVPGAVLTLWTAITEGTRHVDLLDIDSQPFTDGNIISADGTGTLKAGYFAFYGPDGITDGWIDDGSGKRLFIRSNDAGGGAGSVTTVNGLEPDEGGDVTLVAANFADVVPTTRTISTGPGLTGGGSMAANRTHSVVFGTAADTVAQGNDSRFNKSLANLTDGPTSAASDNQVLTWDAGTSRAEWETPASATTDAAALTAGTLNVARLPIVVIVVDKAKATWGSTAGVWPASRPTADPAACVIWIGDTDPGSLALAGDLWLQE